MRTANQSFSLAALVAIVGFASVAQAGDTVTAKSTPAIIKTGTPVVLASWMQPIGADGDSVSMLRLASYETVLKAGKGINANVAAHSTPLISPQYDVVATTDACVQGAMLKSSWDRHEIWTCPTVSTSTAVFAAGPKAGAVVVSNGKTVAGKAAPTLAAPSR